MGYDITFHPITREELKEFVFDVIMDPGLANKRAALISNNTAMQESIRNIYGKMSGFRQMVLNGNYPFPATYSYATAAIAGFLHPYWYARGSCITFICVEERTTGKALKSQSFSDLLASCHRLSPAYSKA
jgi:hypothetical protein